MALAGLQGSTFATRVDHLAEIPAAHLDVLVALGLVNGVSHGHGTELTKVIGQDVILYELGRAAGQLHSPRAGLWVIGSCHFCYLRLCCRRANRVRYLLPWRQLPLGT